MVKAYLHGIVTCFVACDKLTTDLGHKLFRVNQPNKSLTTVVHVTKYAVDFKTEIDRK